jgi:hypothetical protein
MALADRKIIAASPIPVSESEQPDKMAQSFLDPGGVSNETPSMGRIGGNGHVWNPLLHDQ